MDRLVSVASALIVVWIIGYLLIVGSGLIIPLVVAIFIWHLLNTIYKSTHRIPVIGTQIPQWSRMLLALVILAIMIQILVSIISDNVNDVIAASPRYQDNLIIMMHKIETLVRFRVIANVETFMKGISVQNLLASIYGVFSVVMSSAVLIILYIIFLFLEQHFFSRKLDAIFLQPTHRHLVSNIITHIVNDTQTYLGIKTLLSFITAAASWIIMKMVGLDFAEFWALLIFFLNYIPNIGAIIATAFPSLLALIQFGTWLPFLIVCLGLVTIEFIIGNLIEPRYLSQSLNLSPLVILFALAFWGTIWGILGMFLAVPITVMLMIIFAHFEKTRPIAILLSKDGYIRKAYEALPVL